MHPYEKRINFFRIGECVVKFSDEDLVKQEFPSVDIPVLITRSLGKDKGTIDLELTPSFGSGIHHNSLGSSRGGMVLITPHSTKYHTVEKKLTRLRDKAKDESKNWPVHRFEIQGGTISFRLPPNFGDQVLPRDMFAFFKNDATNRGNVCCLTAYQAVDKVLLHHKGNYSL